MKAYRFLRSGSKAINFFIMGDPSDTPEPFVAITRHGQLMQVVPLSVAQRYNDLLMNFEYTRFPLHLAPRKLKYKKRKGK